MRRTIFTLCWLFAAAFVIASVIGCGEKVAEDEKEKHVTGKVPLDGKSPLREIPKEGELNYLTPKPEDRGDYTEFYTIQLGAFSSLENAHKLLSELKSDGYDVFLFESHIKSDSLYKVGLGTFEKKEDARTYLDNLVIPGFEGLWITQVRYGSAVDLDTEKGKGEAAEKSNVAEMVYVSDKAADGDGGAVRWGVWLKRGEEEPLLLADSEETIRRPIISPDGKRVAFIVVENEAGGGKISIADTYGSKNVSSIPAPVALNHHIWISAEVLAYVSTSPSKEIANKIVIYNIIKRKGDVLISSKDNLFENLILSPNGKYIAYDAHSYASGYDSSVLPKNVDSDEAVHVETINLETGSKRVIRAGYTTRLMGWYPDGNLMVAYHQEPGKGKSYSYSFASSDPDGKNIVMLEDIKTVKNVGAGVTSTDGRRIAFVTWEIEDDEGKSKRRTPTELWLLDVERGEAERLLKRDSILYGPSWSPGGDELVITGRIKNRLNVFVVGDLGTGDGGAGKKSPSVKRLFNLDDNSYDAAFH
ncbi:MAG: SPOR domain-containing protein [Deltaproteobacteria bacterium]|uniref:SPOR domain-containing protein n=1 Tax=Candidatus Zymogenus saltonus TaxID=2844893 RepID=A0A9D8PKF6_9DELT|nr:SPOR domain-containing protein [Candidatus Zymogenus saltonus]